MQTGSHSCVVCGSRDLVPCFAAEAVPVHCNVLCPTREQAIAAPRGDIQLMSCTGCSHVFNAAFNEALADYTGAYENSLHYSPTFRMYAEEQASTIVDRYGLHGKTIIEIGCGDAYFLKLLCGKFRNRGIGFEPRHGEDLVTADDNISIIRDYYSAKYSDVTADLVCCRQVLEHISDPVAFLAAIRQAMSANPAAALFLEVPNAACMFRESRIWDVIYEHCSYFTPGSLNVALTRAGFNVHRIEEAFGGQYLSAGATCSGAVNAPNYAAVPTADADTHTEELGDKLRRWQSRLNTASRSVVWGAGSKGAMFLNLLDSRAIDFAVDVNPRKHGMYIAGTGHRIEAPEAIKHIGDVSILLMNPLYEAEVRELLAGMNVRGDIEVV
jgi:hypothetical protein